MPLNIFRSLSKLIKSHRPAPAYLDLLDSMKYQNIPELAGFPVTINSLKTVDQDVRTALADKYPFIGEFVQQPNEMLWAGSKVCPKFLQTDLKMALDFTTRELYCKNVSLDDLHYLKFIDLNTEQWRNDNNYSRDVFTIADLCKKLKKSSETIYLHLEIDSGDEPFDHAFEQRLTDKIQTDRDRLIEKDHSQSDGAWTALWTAIVTNYEQLVFPKQLFIREACLTNLFFESGSVIFSHRYFRM